VEGRQLVPLPCPALKGVESDDRSALKSEWSDLTYSVYEVEERSNWRTVPYVATYLLLTPCEALHSRSVGPDRTLLKRL
jgi:hypothetical protein